MDAAFVADWLNLLLRWAHTIVGIAWVGASFYFIWLDNHLHKPLDPVDAAKGIGGEVWAVATETIAHVGTQKYVGNFLTKLQHGRL